MVRLPRSRPLFQLRQLLLLALMLCAAAPLWARALLPASGSVEVVFSPWDDAEGAIIGTLQQARQAIHVQAYLFTSQPLAQALIAAHRRGVRVEVLADQKMLLQTGKSQIPRLAEAGIPVWLETRHAIAHNKLMLIDPLETHPAVVTGSYNFTYSAQARNAENLLILRDNPALARAYFDNWQRHRGDAVPYTDMETGAETEAAMESAANMGTATGEAARETMP
ncbi:Putative endonuclease (modular protein) [Sterolibacterium denitrificans]|uniref:phospholipase D n=1 Tax=Sterolibacterium denitrificans TaxID=157592 RepID=A0A7Z7MUZ1_9PROT|nr:phospholipase D family protein [Sterolibacterium denitrificans]SMB24779.1 Putative endonuclease (modular protein) [Sterolibacterium denitrificans]